MQSVRYIVDEFLGKGLQFFVTSTPVQVKTYMCSVAVAYKEKCILFPS